MNKKEVFALISLLDDPDESVFNQVSIKFLSLGEEVIPALEDAWEHSFDTLIQNRIENIIHQIQFDLIKEALREWAKPDQQDLLEGALLITRYQYPDVDVNKIHKQIAQIKQDVWLELNEYLTALEKVKIINHILFDVHNFSGNTTNYHAPQNSYMWPLEVLNALAMAERRNRIDAEQRQRLTGFLRDLPVAIDNETASQSWAVTSQLAARHRLTLYDTAYLELALRLGLPLATLDQELRAAGAALGVTLLGL